jgi:hypothetical protein
LRPDCEQVIFSTTTLPRWFAVLEAPHQGEFKNTTTKDVNEKPVEFFFRKEIDKN